MYTCQRCGKEGTLKDKLEDKVGLTGYKVGWIEILILCLTCNEAMHHLMYCFCKNKIDVVGIDQKIVLSEELLSVEVEAIT